MASEIRKVFACGIRNTGNFCVWDPEYKKLLFVRSGIRGNSCVCDREYEKLLFVGSGIRGNFCLWDPEYGEILACGIRNTRNVCLWDPEYGTFLIEGSWSKGIGKSLFVGSGDTGQFLFVGSEILCLGICNSAQGTRNPMTA